MLRKSLILLTLSSLFGWLSNVTAAQASPLRNGDFSNDTSGYVTSQSSASEVVYLLLCEDTFQVRTIIDAFDNPALKMLTHEDDRVLVMVPSIWREALPFDSCGCSTQQSFSLFFMADEPDRASASASSPGAGGTRTMSPLLRMLMEEVAEAHYANLIPMESTALLRLPEVDHDMPKRFQTTQITF